VAKILNAGIGQVILREKDLPPKELLALATALLPIARQTQSRLIINSDLTVASQIRADGLHLPFQAIHHIGDLGKAKKLGLRVGISAHTLEEAVLAEKAGADLVLIGPIFPTSCKPGHPGAGTRLIERIKRRLKIPVWAVGGLNPQNIPFVFKAGATVACLREALLTAPDPAKVAQECLLATESQELDLVS
jgi:thiamine-phosphate pyrophosphorylase